MASAVSVREAVGARIGRVQRAGLLEGVDVGAWPDEAFPPHLASPLADRLAGWVHRCTLEPIVYFPAAVVVPCDVSTACRQWSGGSVSPQQACREYQFFPSSALPSREGSRPYYLRGIFVFHGENADVAEMLVKQWGFRDLTLLECIQVLLQTTQRYPEGWGISGAGSLTTRNPAVPIEGETDTLRLHVCLDWKNIYVRCPVGQPRRPWIERVSGPGFSATQENTYDHHVAICEEIVDPLGVASTVLGALKAYPL